MSTTPPDAWARVSTLFHDALARPASERVAFVTLAAADDAALVADVLALLAAHDRTDAFLDQPVPMAAPAGPVAGAAAHAAAPVDIAGRIIGHYRLERVLGEGGMGVVYLATDTRLSRTVALKAIAPGHPGDTAQRQRLVREARAAAALNHPGIATIYALEELDGQVYMASEYVAGPTLREEMAGGAVGVACAYETLRALAPAVGAAHALGLVHRDLKPENVVRAADGTLKILDFGIARFVESAAGVTTCTGDGGLLGTPAYMAPEQVRGASADARADLFALGVIAYEQASGRHPFEAGHPTATLARVLEHVPERLDVHDPFGLAFDGVVQACLAKTPETRIPSAAHLVDALASLRDRGQRTGGLPAGDTPRAGAPPPRRPARWWWRFHQATAIIAHVLLLLPIWGARDHSLADRGMWLFLVAVLVVSLGGALRMHLLFTARHQPDDWVREHRAVIGVVRLTDVLYAALLLAAGVQAMRAEAPAVLLVAAAASVAVASCVIEPATTRAAWGVVARD